MSVILFGIKSCDTCRKAAKELGAAGIDVEFRDIRAAALTTEELSRFLQAFGDALVNRRSTTWRGLDDNERAQSPEELLTAHPTLMKRPVIEGPSGLTLGWDAAAKATHLPA